MKKIFLLFLALVFLHNGISQTKLIYFRSHSGNIRYFSALEPDNLGWTGHERTFDTAALYLNLSIDTTMIAPYCNNPNATADSLNKNYPFYTTAMRDSANKTTTPAANDTVAKQKERIKSRNEMKENAVVPVSEDFYGNPTNPALPGLGFIAGLLVLLSLIGYLIWMFNRKKMAAV